MEALAEVLLQYGGWGVVPVLAAYLVHRGEITFRYPRERRRNARKRLDRGRHARER